MVFSKRLLFLFTLASISLFAETGFPQAGTTSQTRIVFGPEAFTRTSGATDVYNRSFSVPSYVTGPYNLHIINGQPNGSKRIEDSISSGSVLVNGIEIIGPADFNQTVAARDRTGFHHRDPDNPLM